MEAHPDPYDYSIERLLRAKAREVAELRELLALVAQDLERLAAEHTALASRLLARAQRLRAAALGGGTVTTHSTALP